MTRDTTYRAYDVITANSELPVTLEQMRYHLRNEDLRFDDALLTAYIKSAAAHVERVYGLALLTQTIRQYHASFPCGSDTPLLLRIAPLVSITSITYTDTAGASQTWSSTEYTSGRYNLGGFVTPKVTFTWPGSVAALQNAIAVTYSAGFGSKPSAIPDEISQAIRLIVADMYQRREDTVVQLPKASEHLLQPWYQFAA